MEESHSKKQSQYIFVGLYDAKTGKTRSVRLKPASFASKQEMDEYINKIKKENKDKNKQIKLKREREQLLAKMTAIPEEVVVPSQALELLPDIHQESLDIDLHEGGGNTIIEYGSSRQGKSTLMMYIYDRYFAKKEKINTLFSGNPHLKIYKEDKNLLIGYGFNNRSERYVQMAQYINVKTKNHYEFTFLFDDIIDAKHSKILNKLVLTYRNANISSIIALQYIKLLAKENRGSVNFSAIFRSNSTEDAYEIVDLVLRPYLIERGILHLRDQIAFFNSVTENHGFIWIDNIRRKMSIHRLKLKKKKSHA